jgi:hypothetical protein
MLRSIVVTNAIVLRGIVVTNTIVLCDPDRGYRPRGGLAPPHAVPHAAGRPGGRLPRHGRSRGLLRRPWAGVLDLQRARGGPAVGGPGWVCCDADHHQTGPWRHPDHLPHLSERRGGRTVRCERGGARVAGRAARPCWVHKATPSAPTRSCGGFSPRIPSREPARRAIAG